MVEEKRGGRRWSDDHGPGWPKTAYRQKRAEDEPVWLWPQERIEKENKRRRAVFLPAMTTVQEHVGRRRNGEAMRASIQWATAVCTGGTWSGRGRSVIL